MNLPGLVVVFIIILVVFYMAGYPVPPILLQSIYAAIIILLIVIVLQAFGLLGPGPAMRITPRTGTGTSLARGRDTYL